MADLILIPVLALLFVGAKRYDNGFNKDYLSKDNTLVNLTISIFLFSL